MEMLRNPATLEASAVETNRVLRNTYSLLALTMVPTVLGAWIGLMTGFNLFATGPLIGTLLFMGIAFGFMFAIQRTSQSALGVVLLLAFTGFMGLMLSGMLSLALSFSNGAQLIMMAAGGTGVIFGSLATLATVTKKDYSFMGKFLFIGLILVVVAGLANIFMQIPALSLAISGVAVLLFSAYILYDVSRIVTGGETNYIMATLSIYMNIYNLFVHLLHLLMALAGERD